MSATLTPADPRHGTLNAYVNHRCRCEPCRAARRSYGIERGELTGTGPRRATGPDAARINAAATAAHIRSLLDAGASLTAIARSSGSAYGTIQALAAGTHGEITKATAARLASLTIEQCRSAFTSPGAIQPPGTWITEGACHGRTDLLDLFFPLPSTPRTTTDKATAPLLQLPRHRRLRRLHRRQPPTGRVGRNHRSGTTTSAPRCSVNICTLLDFISVAVPPMIGGGR